jgi:predicted ATP-grasp superfamily ATP-dependent carboligase
MVATTVLLTDPEQRATLAAARALSRAGHRVVTVGVHRGLAGVSRAVSAHHTIAASDARLPTALRQRVAEVVRLEQADVVIPVSDAASRALLGHHERLGAPVAGPNAEAYALASDKARLMALAPECGLQVPRQMMLDHPPTGSAPTVPWAGPLVVKPARSVVEVEGRAVGVGVRFVDRADALAQVLEGFPPQAYPLLLQERTIGDGVGVFLFRSGGETPLVFGHRRLREKPPAGGVSTYREAIAPPAELVVACERLLDALGYEGAAMIEFKRDAATGVFVLMEINARLWGSLQLALDAGVDFPSWLVATALGRTPPPVGAPRTGVRSYWELGEVDHALALLRRSREALHLPAEVAVGWRAAWRAWRDHRPGDRREVFRWSDPAPFAAELLRWVHGQ